MSDISFGQSKITDHTPSQCSKMTYPNVAPLLFQKPIPKNANVTSVARCNPKKMMMSYGGKIKTIMTSSSFVFCSTSFVAFLNKHCKPEVQLSPNVWDLLLFPQI